MDLYQFSIGVCAIIICFSLFCSYTQYQDNKHLYCMESDNSGIGVMFVFSIISTFVMSSYMAFHLALINQGYFYQSRFLEGQILLSFMPTGMQEFSSLLAVSLCLGAVGLVALFLFYFVYLIFFALILSPNGEGLIEDSEKYLDSVKRKNSRMSTFIYLLHQRKVKIPFIHGLASVTVLMISLNILHAADVGKYKFYDTNITLPTDIIKILNSSCYSRSAVYQVDTVTCGKQTLLSSGLDILNLSNRDKGKAVIVVWSEDTEKHRVVLRVDSKFSPPTETIQEMSSLIHSHLHTTNILLSDEYRSKLVTSEHKASWESIEL